MSGFLNKGYLYGVHVTLSAGVVAFRWHQPTGVYETVDLSTVAGNHLELPLHSPSDGHWDLALGVDDQDNVFISGNHRPSTFQQVSTTHLLRCTNVQDFTNPSSWIGEPTPHYDGLGDPSAGTTSINCYHLFERMTDGTLLHFPSIVRLLGTPGHRAWGGFKRRGGTWSNIVDGDYFGLPGDGSTASRIYINSVLVQRRVSGDRVHVTGVWRESPGTDAIHQKHYFYIYSDHPDLQEWRHLTVDPPGWAVQTMPITWDTRLGAAITSGPDWTEGGRKSIYIDPATESPSILIQDRDTPNIFRCYWQPGTGWQSENVSNFTSELSWNSQRYRRTNGPGRMGLRDDLGTLVMLGPQVANVYTYTYDPVWLREKNIFATCMGEDDTPKVWTIGDGARVRIS